MIDELLKWPEAVDRCREVAYGGYLAVASNAAEFTKLRAVYDAWHRRGGQAAGAWIDGYRLESTGPWYCISEPRDYCPSTMKWSANEPNRLASEKCVVVWHSRADGVANYGCTRKLPAICGRRIQFDG